MRKSRIIAIAIAMAVSVAALTAGCTSAGTDSGSGSTAASGDKEVAIITPYYGTPAAKTAMDLFQKDGEAEGWNVTLSDTAGDFNKMNSLMQDAANRKVSAIVVGFPDASQIALGLKAAEDAGVPVIGLDAGTEAVDGIAWNGTSNNKALGEDSAQTLIDGITNGSKSVVMITYNPHPGVRARAEAAKALFEKQGITILASKEVQDPAAATAETRAIIDDLLTANPDPNSIGAIWTGFDAAGLGAVQSLEAAGRDQVPVASVDGEGFAIDAVESGTGPWLVTVAQDWPSIASTAVDVLNGIFDGTQPSEAIQYFPGVVHARK